MEKVKILWAVPCSYYGSEALSEMCKFFKSKGLKFETIGAYKGSDASEIIYDNFGEFDLIVLDSKLKYLEIAERVLQPIAIRNFFMIRIIDGKFKLEETERVSPFQIRGDMEDHFKNIGEILKKFF